MPQKAHSNSTPTLVLSFLWIFFPRPAEQQLNLQTALNYSTRCGTTEYTSGQVTWHQSQEISRTLQLESLHGSIGPVFNDATSDAMPF